MVQANCWLKNTKRCSMCECNAPTCMRFKKLNYLYDNSLLSDKQRQVVPLKPLDEEEYNKFLILQGCINDIENFVKEGKSVYIHSSNCGNGKTSWSIKFIQAYFDKIWGKTSLRPRALFISVPKLLIELKENISKKSEYVEFIKQNIEKADLVVWDDIATKSATTFEAECLFGMIDNRINLGKANIFTSNEDDKGIQNCLGDRLSSRITGSTYNIELKGKDMREAVK